MTVRAREVLASAPVIAYPIDGAGDPGRAYRIARDFCPREVAELPLAMPMTAHGPTLERAWEAAVAAISAQTQAGRDVAYLCLGDTLLYGSFGYLLARYRGAVQVVPGVVSPVAAAAALHLPLTEGREPLVIVPDGGDVDLLGRALALGGTVVVMKPSRLGPGGARLLEETGALPRAWVSEDVTLDSQRLYRPQSAAALAELPYFSLVVIPPAERRGLAG